MPVEIRELVIRAIITTDSNDAKDEEDEEKPRGAQTPMDNTDAVVQECVRQVLRILRKEKDR